MIYCIGSLGKQLNITYVGVRLYEVITFFLNTLLDAIRDSEDFAFLL